MALNQDGGDLFGQAKYEPDSGLAWNGVVVGSVQGNSINLVLTALKDAEQFSCRLTGTYDPASGMIAGDLVQVTAGMVSKRSQFQAMWINPDVSSYKPAEPAVGSTYKSSSGSDANATVTPQTASSPATSASSQASKYHDVREDADRILTGVGDLSQIPIGMGGTGVGGSGMS